MFIKKIEVQGFKSFADRTKILFHPGITAIVGPNGTGKSNIVDAICWALGGLRPKSVRGDRTEDIIFNGNTKRPPLSLAEVVMTLGNEEELVISHRVFRSGESEYRLNGKAVRLKDIQDELWKHSIGEKEYFVIEQGAIGTFVTSKPQEKRALIEEAAGTAYYKDKKRQAQNKLESSEQNLVRLEDIIIEVEKSKNSLYRQALAAARYRRLRERLRELTTHHFYRKMMHLDNSLEEIKTRLNEAEEKEQEALQKVKEEEKALASKRKDLWDLEKQFKDRQEKAYQLKSQLSRLEAEIEQENRRLDYLENTRQKAASDRKELEQEIKAIEEEKEVLQNRLAELERTLESITCKVEEERQIVEDFNRLTTEAENQLAELRHSQLFKMQEATEARNSLSKLEKELEIFQKQAEKLLLQKENFLAQRNQALNRDSELQKEIELGLEEKNRAKIKLQQLSERLQQLDQEISGLESELTRLLRQQAEIQHQTQALEKVAEIERQSPAENLIPEALGWFSDLVEVAPEDAALVDIFWKEEARAQACLLENFRKSLCLRPESSVLLLSEHHSQPLPEYLLQAEGVLGLLKQKVKAGPELEKYLGRLREAVIVRDIPTALNLWEKYPDYNYLTIDGDLLHSTGLLKVGLRKEGLFSISQEKKRLIEELNKLQTEKIPLKNTLDKLTAEKNQLETSIREWQGHLQEINNKLSDREREKKFVSLELQKLETNLSILEKEEKIQQEERNRLQQKREEILSELKAMEFSLEEIQEKLKQKEEALNQLKVQQKAKEESLYQLKAERSLLLEKTNSHRSSLHSLEKRHQALATKLGNLEMETISMAEEKERLARLLVEMKEKVILLDAEAQDQAERLTAQDREVQALQLQLEEMEAHLKELRGEEEKVREERTRLEIRRAEVERDRVNLEETCWQELKKNLIELKQEIEGQESSAKSSVENEEMVMALAEEAEEEAEESTAAEEKTEEKPREKRRGKPPVPARELSDEDLEKELEATREALQRYRAVNLMAEEEYLEQKKRYDFLVQQRQDLIDSIHSTQEAIKKIDEESKTQFLKALEEVNKNFQEIFALLFRGGTAEVKLLEPENPLESGVEIVAQPPGKRVQNLALLSGGEKSLTSLAFLFALFRYKPSPFCILDEVDAALDEVNLSRFLNLMKAIKHQTQFIIITHNYKTMEVADYIYGTTMDEPNITRVYSVRMARKEAEAVEETGPETSQEKRDDLTEDIEEEMEQLRSPITSTEQPSEGKLSENPAKEIEQEGKEQKL